MAKNRTELRIEQTYNSNATKLANIGINSLADFYNEVQTIDGQKNIYNRLKDNGVNFGDYTIDDWTARFNDGNSMFYKFSDAYDKESNAMVQKWNGGIDKEYKDELSTMISNIDRAKEEEGIATKHFGDWGKTFDRDYAAARLILDDVEEDIYAKKKGDNTAVGGFVQGFYDESIFSKDGTDILQSTKMDALSDLFDKMDKIAEGVENPQSDDYYQRVQAALDSGLTKGQKALYQAFMFQNDVDEWMSYVNPRSRAVGKSAEETAEFMAEMAAWAAVETATAGAASAALTARVASLGAKGVRAAKLLKQINRFRKFSQAMKNGSRLQKGLWGAGRTVLDTTEQFAFGAVTGAGLGGSALARKNFELEQEAYYNNLDVRHTGQGELKDGEMTFMDYGNVYRNMLIENLTERVVGGALDDLGDAIGAGIKSSKMGQYITKSSNEIGKKIIKNADNLDFWKGSSTAFKKGLRDTVGWNSLGAEMCEEYVGALMNWGLDAAFGYEDAGAEAKQLFTANGTKELAASMLPMMMLRSGGNMMIGVHNAGKYNHHKKALMQKLTQNIDDADEIKSIIRGLETSSGEEFEQRLESAKARMKMKNSANDKELNTIDEVVDNYKSSKVRFAESLSDFKEQAKNMSDSERATIDALFGNMRNVYDLDQRAQKDTFNEIVNTTLERFSQTERADALQQATSNGGFDASLIKNKEVRRAVQNALLDVKKRVNDKYDALKKAYDKENGTNEEEIINEEVINNEKQEKENDKELEQMLDNDNRIFFVDGNGKVTRFQKKAVTDKNGKKSVALYRVNDDETLGERVSQKELETMRTDGTHGVEIPLVIGSNTVLRVGTESITLQDAKGNKSVFKFKDKNDMARLAGMIKRAQIKKIADNYAIKKDGKKLLLEKIKKLKRTIAQKENKIRKVREELARETDPKEKKHLRLLADYLNRQLVALNNELEQHKVAVELLGITNEITEEEEETQKREKEKPVKKQKVTPVRTHEEFANARELAIQMESAGATAEQILSKTGLKKGAFGVWQWEKVDAETHLEELKKNGVLNEVPNNIYISGQEYKLQTLGVKNGAVCYVYQADNGEVYTTSVTEGGKKSLKNLANKKEKGTFAGSKESGKKGEKKERKKREKAGNEEEEESTGKNIVFNITQNAGGDNHTESGETEPYNRFGVESINEQDREDYINALRTLQDENSSERQKSEASRTINSIEKKAKKEIEELLEQQIEALGIKSVKIKGKDGIQAGLGIYIDDNGNEVVEYTSQISVEVDESEADLLRQAVYNVAEICKQDSVIENNEAKSLTIEDAQKEVVKSKKGRNKKLINNKGFVTGDYQWDKPARARIKFDTKLTPQQKALISQYLVDLGYGCTIMGNTVTVLYFGTNDKLSSLEFLNQFSNGQSARNGGEKRTQAGEISRKIYEIAFGESLESSESNEGVESKGGNGIGEQTNLSVGGRNKSRKRGKIGIEITTDFAESKMVEADKNENNKYTDEDGEETTTERCYSNARKSAGATEKSESDFYSQKENIKTRGAEVSASIISKKWAALVKYKFSKFAPHIFRAFGSRTLKNADDLYEALKDIQSTGYRADYENITIEYIEALKEYIRLFGNENIGKEYKLKSLEELQQAYIEEYKNENNGKISEAKEKQLREECERDYNNAKVAFDALTQEDLEEAAEFLQKEIDEYQAAVEEAQIKVQEAIETLLAEEQQAEVSGMDNLSALNAEYNKLSKEDRESAIRGDKVVQKMMNAAEKAKIEGINIRELEIAYKQYILAKIKAKEQKGKKPEAKDDENKTPTQRAIDKNKDNTKKASTQSGLGHWKVVKHKYIENERECIRYFIYNTKNVPTEFSGEGFEQIEGAKVKRAESGEVTFVTKEYKIKIDNEGRVLDKKKIEKVDVVPQGDIAFFGAANATEFLQIVTNPSLYNALHEKVAKACGDRFFATKKIMQAVNSALAQTGILTVGIEFGQSLHGYGNKSVKEAIEKKLSSLKDYNKGLAEQLDNVAEERKQEVESKKNSASHTKAVNSVIKKYLSAETLHRLATEAQIETARQKRLDAIYQEAMRSYCDKRVADLSTQLKTKIHIFWSESELNEQARKHFARGATGAFDRATGEAYVFAFNCPNSMEVEKTILHEVCGHKGLSKLLGKDEFKSLMLNIYNNANAEIKALIDAKQKQYSSAVGQSSIAIATEEVLAEMAEANVQPTFFQKAIAAIKLALHNLFGYQIKWSNNDIAYLVWRSGRAVQVDNDGLFKAQGISILKYKNFEGSEKENNTAADNTRYSIKEKNGNFASINDISIDELITELNNGKELLFDRFSQEELGGCTKGGRRNEIASALSGRENCTNPTSQKDGYKREREQGIKQEETIEQWARKDGCWIENTTTELEQKYGKAITAGGESVVYDDGESVIKSIGLYYFVSPQLALDRITLHNTLFPETALTVEGFGRDDDGNFQIIVKQPFVNIGNNNALSSEEIQSFAVGLGLTLVDATNNTYVSANGRYYVSDLHDENVIKSKGGNIFVIDADIRFNTPDCLVGGSMILSDNVYLSDNTEKSSLYTQAKAVGLTDKQIEDMTAYRIVWHGTSADFDEFDSSHIGEGEGAQAHGWGHYVAVSREVGENYASDQNHLYKVDIPDNGYLEEQEVVPINEAQQIKDALYNHIIENDNEQLYEGELAKNELSKELNGLIGQTAMNLYGTISDYLGGAREASAFLNSLGYNGIHYGGRGDGECYVVFNSKDLKILENNEKNGNFAEQTAFRFPPQFEEWYEKEYKKEAQFNQEVWNFTQNYIQQNYGKRKSKEIAKKIRQILNNRTESIKYYKAMSQEEWFNKAYNRDSAVEISAFPSTLSGLRDFFYSFGEPKSEDKKLFERLLGIAKDTGLVFQSSPFGNSVLFELGGYYDYTTHSIIFPSNRIINGHCTEHIWNNKNRELYQMRQQVILHEMLHSVTKFVLMNDINDNGELDLIDIAENLLTYIVDEISKNPQKYNIELLKTYSFAPLGIYGFSDVEEFISEIPNSSFLALLQEVKYHNFDFSAGDVAETFLAKYIDIIEKNAKNHNFTPIKKEYYEIYGYSIITNANIKDGVAPKFYTIKELADILGVQEIDDNTAYRIVDYTAEERAILESAVRDEDGHLLAPNGKPTNLDERQWVQVRTDNFKKWFGDWENDPENASQAVDENGEPKVWYRGSKSGKGYTVFENDGSMGSAGFFFTDRKDIAEEYADEEGYRKEDKEYNIFPMADMEGKTGVYPVFLNVRNINRIDAQNNDWEHLGEVEVQDWQVYDRDGFAIEDEIYPFKTMAQRAAQRVGGTIAQEDFVYTTSLTADGFAALSEEYGYDGAMIENVKDVSAKSALKSSPYATDMVVFHPNQIKSATDNNGEFSTENDDIRYSIKDRSVPFEVRQAQAVANKGTVTPNLATTEFNILDIENHKYNGTKKEILKQAFDDAIESLVGVHNSEIFGEISISKSSIDKMLSNAKKDMYPHTYAASINHLLEIINNSIEVEEHPDVKKGENGKRNYENGTNDELLIHELYGAIRVNGDVFRTRTIIKEYQDDNTPNNAYSYEVVEIEMLDTPTSEEHTPPLNTLAKHPTISGAKLLKNVDKANQVGVKILDESENIESDTEQEVVIKPELAAQMERSLDELSRADEASENDFEKRNNDIDDELDRNLYRLFKGKNLFELSAAEARDAISGITSQNLISRWLGEKLVLWRQHYQDRHYFAKKAQDVVMAHMVEEKLDELGVDANRDAIRDILKKWRGNETRTRDKLTELGLDSDTVEKLVVLSNDLDLFDTYAHLDGLVGTQSFKKEKYNTKIHPVIVKCAKELSAELSEKFGDITSTMFDETKIDDYEAELKAEKAQVEVEYNNARGKKRKELAGRLVDLDKKIKSLDEFRDKLGSRRNEVSVSMLLDLYLMARANKEIEEKFYEDQAEKEKKWREKIDKEKEEIDKWEEEIDKLKIHYKHSLKKSSSTSYAIGAKIKELEHKIKNAKKSINKIENQIAYNKTLRAKTRGKHQLITEFGITYDELIQKVENSVSQESIDNMWSAIQEASEFIREQGKESGFYNKFQYERLNRFEYYVPQRGWLDRTLNDSDFSQSEQISPMYVNIDSIPEGADSLGTSPLVWLKHVANRYIEAGEHNKLKAEAFNFYLRNEKFCKEAGIIRFIGNNTTMTPQDSSLMTDAEFEDCKMSVTIDGKDYTIIFDNKNGSRYLARCYNDATLKSKGGDKWLMRGLRKLKSYTSRLLTTYNPKFVVENSIRDYSWAAIRSSMDYGMEFSTEMMRELASVKENMLPILQMLASGKHNYKSVMLKEFMEDAGMTSFYEAKTRDEEIRELIKLFDNIDKKGGDVKAALKKLAQQGSVAASLVSEAIDANLRFCAYKTARSNGYSRKRAADIARNISVNFQRSGDGGWGASFFQDLVPFFNPTMQGIYSLIDTIKEHPYKMAAASAGVFTLAFAMACLALSGSGGDDDDDDELRKNLSQYSTYDMETKLIIGKGFAISAPEQFRPMVYLANMAAANFCSKNEPIYNDMAQRFGYSIMEYVIPTPNATKGAFAKDRDLTSVIGGSFGIAGAVALMFANKTTLGGNIVSHDDGSYADYLEARTSTRDMYIALNHLLSPSNTVESGFDMNAEDNSFVSNMKAKLIDIAHPDALQYMSRTFLGSAAKVIENVYDMFNGNYDIHNSVVVPINAVYKSEDSRERIENANSTYKLKHWINTIENQQFTKSNNKINPFPYNSPAQIDHYLYEIIIKSGFLKDEQILPQYIDNYQSKIANYYYVKDKAINQGVRSLTEEELQWCRVFAAMEKQIGGYLKYIRQQNQKATDLKFALNCKRIEDMYDQTALPIKYRERMLKTEVGIAKGLPRDKQEQFLRDRTLSRYEVESAYQNQIEVIEDILYDLERIGILIK